MQKIKRFAKNYKFSVPVAIFVLFVLFGVARAVTKKPVYQTVAVTKATVEQEVAATGVVKPAEAVDMGFESGGKVANINVKVGDLVKAGTVLASLQNSDAVANYSSAKARLTELLRGARSEDIAVSAAGVSSAELELNNSGASLAEKINDTYVKADDAVRNHVDRLFDSPENSHPSFGKTVSSGGTVYFVGAQDANTKLNLENERVQVEKILDTWMMATNSPQILTKANTALSDLQIVQTFLNDTATAVNSLSSTNATVNDVYSAYKTDISSARTNAAAAITSLRTSIQAYTSSQSGLSLAQRQQDLKQAPATSEQVQIQQAAVSTAQAAYLRTIIVAPFDGLITKITPEKGEIVSPGMASVSMISASNLQVEVNIPESDIPKIKVGASADITFDAYGKDFVATATVATIDPAATIVESVPTYRTVLSFNSSDPRILSGMTANIKIHGDRRDNVLAVPQRAVINGDNTRIVQVVVGGKIVETPVTTGLRGSEGNVEITSGLSEGQLVIASPSAKK